MFVYMKTIFSIITDNAFFVLAQENISWKQSAEWAYFREALWMLWALIELSLKLFKLKF